MNFGIIGAPGAGKDMLASYLTENKGYKRLAFADQIKKEYYAASGFSEGQFKERDGREQEIRDGLWKYSAQMKELYGEFYFIEPVFEQLNGKTIITDIRTELELIECVLRTMNIFIVVRDAPTELSGRKLLGTQLPLADIIGTYPIFWNVLNDLEETHKNFDAFLERYFGGTNGPR